MINLYVTSSSSKCGKTFISMGLAVTMQSLGYSTTVYKPVQNSGIEMNGFMQSPDLTQVKSMDPYINTHFTYLYKSDSEPLIASEIENNPIDVELILSEFKRISSNSDCTIIDGEGEILSPLAPDTQNADLISKLNIPMLIVTIPDENAVNNTLMTIFTAAEKGIDVRGVVINNIYKDSSTENLTSLSRIIEEYTNVKVLGLINRIENKITPEDLITSILNGVDIESIFNIKIEKLDIE